MSSDESATTSKRPYLIRAMHEWMSDNNLTPHLVVDAEYPEVVVPREHVSDGKLILNASHLATRDLTLGNDWIEFEARFGGKPHRLSIPVTAVLGIYARETGQGMIFTEEEPEQDPPDGGPPAGKPQLKIVR